MKLKTIYNKILKGVEKKMNDHDTTTANQLVDICSYFFKDKFKGVYPADLVPSLTNNEYCIVNLDNQDEPGSHWVALAKTNNILYFYDSFGRNQERIISLDKKTKYSKNGGEQKQKEKNCGQRCITFLMIGDYFGFKIANKI